MRLQPRRRAPRGSRTRRRPRASSATSGTSATCARSRCRSSTCSPRGRRRATWGEWLDRFAALAPRVLRQPERRAARARSSCARWPTIGPVSLDEARDVLADRLQTARDRSAEEPLRPGVRRQPAAGARPHVPRRVRRRARRADVPAAAARGSDAARREMREPLGGGPARCRKIARAASACCCAWRSARRPSGSGSRIRGSKSAESRPRVPCFYALDIMRAITGRIPKPQQLQDAAAAEGGAGLAWPAPAQPGRRDRRSRARPVGPARSCSQVEPRASVRGHAHYLLRLNEPLRRSVVGALGARPIAVDAVRRPHARHRHDAGRCSTSQRLGARPYSLSALQKFAACPYQFLLSAIYRLEPPPDDRAAAEARPADARLDLPRGAGASSSARCSDGRPPAARRRRTRPPRWRRSTASIAEVAARVRENLAPAIDRVWRDEIADIAPRSARLGPPPAPPTADAGWVPAYFEFAFGLPGDDDRDPAQRARCRADRRPLQLRGSVDLIEARRDAGGAMRDLRITDHKTGQEPDDLEDGDRRRIDPAAGALQPGDRAGAAGAGAVAGGSSTARRPAGSSITRSRSTTTNRRIGLEALEIVDRAIELGFLPAAPAERACTWCDFRAGLRPGRRRAASPTNRRRSSATSTR